MVPSAATQGQIDSNKMVVRTVRVDRSRTAVEAIRATKREEHIFGNVLDSFRHVGTEEEVTLYYHNFGRYLTPDELEQEVEKLGHFRLADLFEATAQNEADPVFADRYPNATQRRDEDGKWRAVTFFHWHVGRHVVADWVDVEWHDRWWYPLVPISTSD